MTPVNTMERWTPTWPKDRTCASMLSFDLDGITLWARGGNNPNAFGRAVSLGNYGPDTAVPRILELLQRLDIPATFFIPSFIVENWPDVAKRIRDGGHEIGVHGHLHETFHSLDSQAQEELLDKSLSIFDKVLDVKPLGFRAPSGDWTIETPRILARMGLSYSSSYRGDDRPFRWCFDDGSRLTEIPGHWELDDFPQFAYNDFPAVPTSQDRPAPARETFENWEWEFDAVAAEHLSWVLMTHPQTIGTPNRLRRLEKLLRKMIRRGDVWMARGHEIAEWVDDRLNEFPGVLEVER